jgi:hypothetical protein
MKSNLIDLKKKKKEKGYICALSKQQLFGFNSFVNNFK